MVEEIAQSHLVTYGMDSFNFVGDMVTLTLCKCLWQEQGNDFCGYYVCEFIYNATCKSKQGYSQRQFDTWQMRNELLPEDHMKAIQEELAGFFLDHVINKAGEYHVEIDFNC